MKHASQWHQDHTHTHTHTHAHRTRTNLSLSSLSPFIFLHICLYVFFSISFSRLVLGYIHYLQLSIQIIIHLPCFCTWGFFLYPLHNTTCIIYLVIRTFISIDIISCFLLYVLTTTVVFFDCILLHFSQFSPYTLRAHTEHTISCTNCLSLYTNEIPFFCPTSSIWNSLTTTLSPSINSLSHHWF